MGASMADLDNYLLAYIRNQMSRGQIVLFTGAGFSFGARSRRGDPIPTSTSLRDALLEIAYPGEPVEARTSLNDAFAVALKRNRDAVRALFDNRLSVAPDSLADYYRLYFSMPWYRVYTLNIDDLEAAAAQRFDLRRQPVSASATTLASEQARRPGAGVLEVVHLNGILSDPLESMTFSDAQYGSRSAGPDSWYIRCAIDLQARPVIYVGTELNESTLWQHVELRRRHGVESEILPPRGILVTPDLTRARADMLRAFNVEWLKMTAEEFAASVLRETLDAAARGFAFLGTYNEDYGRAGIPLVSELAAERPTLDTEYLSGQEPQWADLVQGRAITRTNDEALIAVAKEILSGSRERTALGVTGTAGSGKSTALMRVALDLSNQGVPVLWVDRDSQASPTLIRKRIAEFDDRVVLAIDDADTFGNHMVRLLRDIVPSRHGLLVAFAMPSTRFDELSGTLKRTGEAEVVEHVVANLSDGDIDGLLRVLDRNNRLGVLTGLSEEARRRALRERCGRQLIVAMVEATSDERFDEKIAKELSSLPPVQQFVYALLCIAAREKHYLTRDEVLLACQGLPGDPLEALSLMVRRHIAVAPPPGTQYRPRHRVIADIVFERLHEAGQIAAPVKALLHGLASKAEPRPGQRDRVWRLLTRLMSHDYLLRVTDIAEAREIYARIEPLLASDYHYWLQRGSMEVEHGALRTAELFLNQARGLAPADYRVDTEYGYLLMRKGIDAPHDAKAKGWVEEGTRLLEAVISSRGDVDDYPYHVLGAQGLAWTRRARTVEERRRLLMYYENVVEQGVRKHPFRRNLNQLRQDIRRDLLLTVAR